jgi:uncharacterized repeat protein (TIGR03803 family)
MTYKEILSGTRRTIAIVTAALVVILVCAPADWAETTYKVLYSFNGVDGNSPESDMIRDDAGNLYGGTPYGGGWSGNGNIFEMIPQADGTWTEKVLYQFSGGDDDFGPRDVLALDPAGNLYGGTVGLFDTLHGNVFELTPNSDGSWKESALFEFPDLFGGGPSAGLVRDAVGHLYGVTSRGGTSGCGSVFELTFADGSWTEQELYDFKGGRDGCYPGPLTLDDAGTIYGTTSDDTPTDTVFALSLQNGEWKKRLLYTFTGGIDGAYLRGALAIDHVHNLYGTGYAGGTTGNGTVFRLKPNHGLGTWRLEVLHQFRSGRDGSGPLSGVAIDHKGNLFGTTGYGGGGACYYGCGTVFMLMPTSDGKWKYRLLYAFTGGADGALPWGGLVADPAGNLFGTTTTGGDSQSDCGSGIPGCGVVFEITP